MELSNTTCYVHLVFEIWTVFTQNVIHFTTNDWYYDGLML
jgi:hypothetical protein